MPWLRRKAALDTSLLRGPQTIPAFPGIGDPSDAGPVRASAFFDFIGGSPDALYPEPNFPSNADVGFDKNELVYACIMEKATSLPDAPLRVFGPDGMGKPREDHPLRQLISNPNPCATEFELMELTSIYLDLAGVAFWEIVLGRSGKPVELWPLRPDLVRILPRKDGNHEYGYVLGGGKLVDLGTNVLKFTMPNPMHPWLGQAPMRPANRAVALDNEATDFVKHLLQNRAVPGTVIETEQKIDETLTERLTEKWIQRFGGNNRGRPAFMQKGMKVHPVGLDLQKLEFPDLRTLSESRICMSFGVPPILVGAKVGLDRSTFSNYREARVSLWEETLMPLQKRMQQTIVKRLLPMLEGPRPRRTVVRFDNSEVLALRESEGKRWELGTQALRAGGISRQQFCRYVGLPDPGGEPVYLTPAGVIPSDVEGKPLHPEDAQPEPEPTEDEDEQVDPDTAETAKMIAEIVDRQERHILDDMRRRKVAVYAGKYQPPWETARWNTALEGVLKPLKGVGALELAHQFNNQTRQAVEVAVATGPDPELSVSIAFAHASTTRALELAEAVKEGT
jgi:HK97 family phage portal protein